MRKFIYALAIIPIMTGTILTSCQHTAGKVENAQDKVQDAKDKVQDASAEVIEAEQELNQALKDSIQQFKKESEEKILANIKSLDEYKAIIANENMETKASFDKILIDLEQKNSDLRKKLDEFKEESQDKWQIFKTEFSHDMDELEKAFQDFTVKNS
jgi:acetyl-CoA carboxylase carboxyltransferase component